MSIRSERGLGYLGTWLRYVPNVVEIRSERGLDTFRTWSWVPRNVVVIRSEPIRIRSEPILIRSEPTIPLKSRSPDVKVSGLIVRRKGVDMLPVASSVKGRKVRIRARVRLPNRYPVWW